MHGTILSPPPAVAGSFSRRGPSQVSINLALAGKNLVEFVGLVDAEPELYTAPVIERAIARPASPSWVVG